MRPNAILHEAKQHCLDLRGKQHLRLNTQILRDNRDEGIGVQAWCLPLLPNPLNQ
jgi:hypothetical protein